MMTHPVDSLSAKGRSRRPVATALALVFAAGLSLSGCGLFGGGDSAESAAANEGRVLVPTFTPTPEGQAPQPTPTLEFAASDVAAAPAITNTAPAVTSTAPITAQGGVTASAPVTAADAAAQASPTLAAASTPAARARLIVDQDLINVRTGPGLNYGLGGTANKGQEFDIVAKDATGEWWQVCCVSGEPVWVYGQLARVENTEAVAVAQNIAAPAAPVAEAAPAPAPAPAAPEPEPTEPPAAEEPAPAPAADPCAGIGGDGCKFKLRGGPAFAPNGGGEIKLTLAFIHSGIDGGQPQGSYFPVLLKDGQNVGVPDSVRSFDPSIGMREGPNGRYNYEYKIDLGRLPGNTVAGNYTIWVLDGNGERDSQDYNFTVPEGQGEIWIQFDQA